MGEVIDLNVERQRRLIRKAKTVRALIPAKPPALPAGPRPPQLSDQRGGGVKPDGSGRDPGDPPKRS